MLNLRKITKVRKPVKALKNLEKQVAYYLHVDDDILPEAAKRKARALLAEAEQLHPEETGKITDFLAKAPKRLSAIFPPKSWPTIREYADILAVAMCVAFGIRALFLQPFKIPTSSMQPTLFGIHYIADKNTLPHLPGFLHYLLFSTQRAKCRLAAPGELYPESITPISRYIIFPWTRFRIGDMIYDLPGDNRKVYSYCHLGDKLDRELPAGEVLCDGWLSLGDHLFVDRFTFHFREPKRGDIIVFNTEHFKKRVSGYYYIKRLVGLPGDTLRLKNNMIYVKPRGAAKEQPITTYAPVFNKLYSFKGGYHGHVYSRGPSAEYLTDENATVTVPEDSYFAMGDNSINSWDSRYWGFVPRKNLVGRALFIFWPFSRRWGLVDRQEPLDIKTVLPDLPSMHLQ